VVEAVHVDVVYIEEQVAIAFTYDGVDELTFGHLSADRGVVGDEF